jgi:hypothetical protein
MNTRTSYSLLIALACFLASVSVQGAVVYDNTTTPVNGGMIITYGIPADDFQLSQDASLYGATLSLYGTNFETWDLSGEWAIFSNGTGYPGSIHASGPATNPQLVGSDYTFDFGTNVMVNAATTYWLGFHAWNAESAASLAWRGQSPVVGSTSANINLLGVTDYTVSLIGNYGNSNDWTMHPTHDLVFKLHGTVSIPEPAPLGLLAVALIAMGLIVRHRKLL